MCPYFLNLDLAVYNDNAASRRGKQRVFTITMLLMPPTGMVEKKYSKVNHNVKLLVDVSG